MRITEHLMSLSLIRTVLTAFSLSLAARSLSTSVHLQAQGTVSGVMLTSNQSSFIHFAIFCKGPYT